MNVNFSGKNFKSVNDVSVEQQVFDLASNEKNRLVRGYQDVLNDLSEKWKSENANAQIFPGVALQVHPAARDYLLEFSRVNDYDEIAREANLDEKGRNALGHIVWKMAQSKDWSGLQNEVASQIGQIPAVSAVTQLLEQKIIGKVKMLTEKPVTVQRQNEVSAAKETKLPLSQVLSQYPNLGEQPITSNPLKLRYFAAPLKPSVKNWITDYHDCLGAGKHSTMDRGNYLFHSENGKRLTPIERQKISMLLKSLDEESLLDVDTIGQKIVFNIANQEISRENRFINSSDNGLATPVAPEKKVQPLQKDKVFFEDDLAQSRIRKSLDFSNLQAGKIEKKEDVSRIFGFEDGDYASRMRGRISPNLGPGLVNSVVENGDKKTGLGTFSFSSAQELPVEKQTEKIEQVFNVGGDKKVQETGKVSKTWNSPDFKSQISVPNKIGSAQQSVQIDTEAAQNTNPLLRPKRTHSPYMIVPSGWRDMGAVDDAYKTEPKIQGNVVDLS